MHSFKLQSVALIFLSACAVIKEASGMSNIWTKRLGSQNGKLNSAIEGVLTNGTLPELKVLFPVKRSADNLRSTGNKDVYSQTQRTRRFTAYTLNIKEGNIDKAFDDADKNNRRTTQNTNSTRASDSAKKLPNKGKKVTIFKDPNRTRRLKQVQQQTLPGENTESDVTSKADSKLSTGTINPDSTGKTFTGTRDEEFHATGFNEKVITEFVKSQNRPPWLSQIPDNINSDDGTIDSDKTVTKNGENNATINYVTTLDNTTDNITVPYQNNSHATTQPDGAGSPIISFKMNADDKLTTSGSQSSTPTPRKNKRRRTQHEKNKNKRLNNGKKHSKLRHIKGNVSKKSSNFSEAFQNVSAPKATEHKYSFTQEPLKPPVFNQEEVEGYIKTSNPSDDCPTCGKQRMTEEEVKMLRLGMFQDLLMKKLRVDPDELIVEDTVAVKHLEDNLPKLPPSMVEQTYEDNSWEEEKEEFFAQDQEIVIPGDDMGRNCIGFRATGCYSFDLEGKVKGEVASAALWLYKMRDATDINGQTFFVYELEQSREGQLMRRNLAVRKDTFTKEDWVSMNITRAVKRMIDRRRGREMLAVRCKTCATRNHKALYGTKYGYKPLLVIKYSNGLSTRGKRSTPECDPTTRCCKHPLVANFHALSMPSIFSPANLSIGYCFGYCESIDLFTYNHTSLKQNMRLSAMSGDSVMREQLKPCCVPLLLKDTFIMTSRDGYIVRQLLPKVIVEKCGCL